MSLWERIFAKRQVPPPSPRETSVVAWPHSTDAGIYVDETVTIGSTTAMACATLMARTLAMLPNHVMVAASKDASDGNINLTDHPVQAMLQRAPNGETTAMALKEMLFLSAVLNGNSYCEIERDQAGRPFALWPIPHHRVTPCRDEAGALFYEVSNGGGEKVYLPARDVLHVKGPSLDGIVGLSIIGYARHTIALSVSQERFASSFIRNAAAPSGFIKIAAGISEDGLKRVKAQVDSLYSGPRRAGRIMIGDGTWDWQPIGLSPQDSEFLAQRRFTTEELCRVFGVPPQLVGSTDSQTFANFEAAGQNYLSLCILPWVVRYEQEINTKLLTQRVNGRLPFLKVNTSAVTRANLEAQTKAFTAGRMGGWFSANDIRRLMDLEPIEGGDQYLIPLNTTPIDLAPPALDDEDQRRTAAMRVVK